METIGISKLQFEIKNIKSFINFIIMIYDTQLILREDTCLRESIVVIPNDSSFDKSSSKSQNKILCIYFMAQENLKNAHQC